MPEFLSWHFIREDKRLGHDDNRLVEVGKTLTVEGGPILCKHGLHVSKRALDALSYAPGPIACRVKLGGQVFEGDDKMVGTERTVLWMVDASRILHEFAVWCARRALERERAAGREPDPRSWDALAVKLRWLDGDATNGELVAAYSAAQSAARAAARAAVRAAARAAARAAVWAAVWAAAGTAADAAAGAAAQSVAYSAAYSAAWAAWAAESAAAWAAVWDAAQAAAQAELNTELERRLTEERE